MSGDFADIEEEEEEHRDRECSEFCPHFDSLNLCCWQATEKGLYFDVDEGDYCHLGYEENDGK